MRPKKLSTMTSLTSHDEDDVTVTSSQDGGDAETRRNVTPRQHDQCLPRSVSLDQGQGHYHDLNNGQDRGQSHEDHSQSQGRNYCQDRKPDHIENERHQSILKSSSCDEVLCPGRIKTTSTQKPPKPVKPRNLWSSTRSRDVNENEVGSPQTGSSLRSRDLPVESVELLLSSSSSHVKAASQQRTDDCEKTCGQNSLQSDVKHLTQRTTTSTEPMPQSAHDIRSSESSGDGVGVTCRQGSPRCADNQLTPWTTVSTPSVSQSLHIERISQTSDVDVETTCEQSSPRCNGVQQIQWTKASQEVSVSPSDRIEPPVIYDLLPANVHLRRGGSLQLVAQFTAFPAPDISWYRANDLLTPGTSTCTCIATDVSMSHWFMQTER